MLSGEYLALVAVGGVFLILGLATVMWGRHEEKSYFDGLATRTSDLREFVDRWPPRPQPGSLKTGGWIAIAIGLLTIVVGMAFFLWTRTQA